MKKCQISILSFVPSPTPSGTVMTLTINLNSGLMPPKLVYFISFCVFTFNGYCVENYILQQKKKNTILHLKIENQKNFNQNKINQLFP